MDSLALRILAADAARHLRAPCCGRVHQVDPSLRRDVHCCGKTLTPKRIGLSLVLVERASA